MAARKPKHVDFGTRKAQSRENTKDEKRGGKKSGQSPPEWRIEKVGITPLGRSLVCEQAHGPALQTPQRDTSWKKSTICHHEKGTKWGETLLRSHGDSSLQNKRKGGTSSAGKN